MANKLPPPVTPAPSRTNYTMRLSPEERAAIEKLGGASWLRECIRLAMQGEKK